MSENFPTLGDFDRFNSKVDPGIRTATSAGNEESAGAVRDLEAWAEDREREIVGSMQPNDPARVEAWCMGARVGERPASVYHGHSVVFYGGSQSEAEAVALAHAKALWKGRSGAKSLDDYADELSEFKAKVVALLKRIETSESIAVCSECRNMPGKCPICGGDCCVGENFWMDHLPDCELAALLKEAQE